MVGILDVILASCGSCGDKNDIYFLVTVLVIFSMSFLHLTCSLLDVFKANWTSRGMVNNKKRGESSCKEIMLFFKWLFFARIFYSTASPAC